jgi:dipeptidyl aminopeptidase/acylaminoacyl peptidase
MLDIGLGVDALVAQGLIDSRRVAILGWSYGGYAAAWACVDPAGRYACAVMGAGISDWSSACAESVYLD